MQAFNQFFTTMLVQLTLWTGNLGIAIILFTIILRLLLTPLSIIGLRMSKKMQEVQPELSKLQKQYKSDPKKLQQEQMLLYKKYGINPVAGCIPQLLQIGLLIALYRSFIYFFSLPIVGTTIAANFLWLNLTKPDPYFILPIIAGVTQFVLSLMSIPAPSPESQVEKSKTPKKSNTAQSEKKSSDMGSMMSSTLQTQMVFIFPIMTAVIALKLPSGLVLYWIVSTLISMVQQWYVGRWGKLGWYIVQFRSKKVLKKV